jgi:hypothetical protein
MIVFRCLLHVTLFCHSPTGITSLGFDHMQLLGHTLDLKQQPPYTMHTFAPLNWLFAGITSLGSA